jgi:hypothetical protein
MLVLLLLSIWQLLATATVTAVFYCSGAATAMLARSAATAASIATATISATAFHHFQNF